jgi:hypothetical protein
MTRRNLFWGIFAGLYALALAVLGWAIAQGSDGVGSVLLAELLLVVAPGGVFALAAYPLWRGVRHPFVLLPVAVLAGLSGFVVIAATWGLAFPIGLPLIGLGIADLAVGVAALGFGDGGRTAAVIVALLVVPTIGLGAPGIAVALVLAALYFSWRLLRRRRPAT